MIIRKLFLFRNRRIFLLCSIFIFSSTHSHAAPLHQKKQYDFQYLKDNFKKFYESDYNSFFDVFNKQADLAKKCTKINYTKEFFSIAPDIMGNSEVSEAFSEVVENILLSNTKCFYESLKISKAKVRKIVCEKMSNPTFVENSEVKMALNSFKELRNYPICIRL